MLISVNIKNQKILIVALGTAPVKLTSYLKHVCDFALATRVKSDATPSKPGANRVEIGVKQREGVGCCLHRIDK